MKRKSLSYVGDKENSKLSVFKMFTDALDDPIKKKLILTLLSQEAGVLNNDQIKALKNHCTPTKKAEKKKFESPTALLRRRQLLQQNKNDEPKSTEFEESPRSTQTPYNELLTNVVAYVEVKTQGADRSSGVKALLMSMGATISEKLQRGVTHVIFKDGSFETYQKAKMLRAYFLSVLWVDAIRRKRQLVPESEYPALSSKNYDHNVSFLCSQMQKNYEDVVREEIKTNLEQGVPLPSTKSFIEKRKRMTVGEIHEIFDSSRSSFTLSENRDFISCSYENEHECNSDLISDDDSTCGIVDGENSTMASKTPGKSGMEFTCFEISDDFSQPEVLRELSNGSKSNSSDLLSNDINASKKKTHGNTNRFSLNLKNVLHEIVKSNQSDDNWSSENSDHFNVDKENAFELLNTSNEDLINNENSMKFVTKKRYQSCYKNQSWKSLSKFENNKNATTSSFHIIDKSNLTDDSSLGLDSNASINCDKKSSTSNSLIKKKLFETNVIKKTNQKYSATETAMSSLRISNEKNSTEASTSRSDSKMSLVNKNRTSISSTMSLLRISTSDKNNSTDATPSGLESNKSSTNEEKSEPKRSNLLLKSSLSSSSKGNKKNTSTESTMSSLRISSSDKNNSTDATPSGLESNKSTTNEEKNKPKTSNLLLRISSINQPNKKNTSTETAMSSLRISSSDKNDSTDATPSGLESTKLSTNEQKKSNFLLKSSSKNQPNKKNTSTETTMSSLRISSSDKNDSTDATPSGLESNKSSTNEEKSEPKKTYLLRKQSLISGNNPNNKNLSTETTMSSLRISSSDKSNSTDAFALEFNKSSTNGDKSDTNLLSKNGLSTNDSSHSINKNISTEMSSLRISSSEKNKSNDATQSGLDLNKSSLNEDKSEPKKSSLQNDLSASNFKRNTRKSIRNKNNTSTETTMSSLNISSSNKNNSIEDSPSGLVFNETSEKSDNISRRKSTRSTSKKDKCSADIFQAKISIENSKDTIGISPFVTERKKVKHKLTENEPTIENSNRKNLKNSETPLSNRRKSLRIQLKDQNKTEPKKLSTTSNESDLKIDETPKQRTDINKDSIIKSLIDHTKRKLILDDEIPNKIPPISKTPKKTPASKPKRSARKNLSKSNCDTINETLPLARSQSDSIIFDESRSLKEKKDNKARKLRKLYDPQAAILDLQNNCNNIGDEQERQIKRQEINRAISNNSPNLILSAKAKKCIINSKSGLENIASIFNTQNLLKELLKTPRDKKKKTARYSSVDEQKELLDEIRRKKYATQTPLKSARKVGRIQALTQVPPHKPSSRRSSLEFEMEIRVPQIKRSKDESGIVFTRLQKNEQKKFSDIVKQLGGYSIESTISAKSTHLVVGEIKRTINLVRGIARGCWILKKEWITDSLKANRWLPEEDYELTAFSPTVQKCRLEREAFGSDYTSNIFQNYGAIFIDKQSTPPYAVLKELIILCQGKISKTVEEAELVIGNSYDNIKCVKEKWILDSICSGKLKSLKKYLIINHKSPHV